MLHSKSLPCYIANGGAHGIVNVPMGIFTRLELKKLVRVLLQHHRTLGTFVAAPASPRTLQLLRGLEAFLEFDLKPKAERSEAEKLLAVNEKNLSQAKTLSGSGGEPFNMVTFAVSCGLIAFLFMLQAHLNYLESL